MITHRHILYCLEASCRGAARGHRGLEILRDFERIFRDFTQGFLAGILLCNLGFLHCVIISGLIVAEEPDAARGKIVVHDHIQTFPKTILRISANEGRMR